jgi:small subunit ribosomal protein S5
MYNQENDTIEKIINIKRHSKTVKGGRLMSFTALVVVGDKKGKIGIGKGKSKQFPNAIQKAIENGKKNMKKVVFYKNTVQYEHNSYYKKSKVFLKPAAEGTGIISSNTMRSIFEAVGIKNILAKNYGSKNPVNVTKATLKCLLEIESVNFIASKRGISVKYLINKQNI